ncbi:NAD(P)H-binding protein [Streptomyces sp. GS7]|uniref:NAD(P)H-binding protein n=1 Tax=Streptomyces sp. GS7 TaxID=2692234 RepID=UPI001317F650|nr:NAD(P)H-binding protein [Streptomyces sp. GS7]QHC23091.1 NAD(P)H-binding protein [Streptomyces sp. GS7]
MTRATGTVGRPLVRALRDRGVPVRALVRDAGRLPAEWDEGVEAVVADLGDPDSLAPAVAGVDAVYLLTPVHPEADRQQRHVIEAAAKEGRPRVVLHAAIGLGRSDVSPVRFFAAHRAGLDQLTASGLDWTALAPNGFWQNFLGMAETLRSGMLALPAGEAPVSYVDARDVAEVAAAVLTTGGHERTILDVTGPETLTHAEIAARTGALLGREVAYRALTAAQAREALLAIGMGAWQADGLIELYGLYGNGEAATVADTVPRLLGRPARSLDDFLNDHASVFRGTPTT